MFHRKQKPPTRDELERKLEEIGRRGDSEPPLRDDEVTGVIDCALERLREETESSDQRLRDAADVMGEDARTSLRPGDAEELPA